MKKLIAAMLALCLAMLAVPAFASTDARLNTRIATRSGPATSYTEPGSFLAAGDEVIVHSKVRDDVNEIWWVQVEFTYRGEKYRVYTGDWRLDVNLDYVPYEIVEDYSSRVLYTVQGWAGPGYDYHQYDDVTVRQNTWCQIIEVENDFALVDTTSSNYVPTRFWVPLWMVDGGDAFYGQDTFTGHYPSLDDGYYWNDDYYWEDDGPTLIGGTDNSAGNSSLYDSFPIGWTCRVWVDSGHARTGAGTQYDHAAYVNQGDTFVVLDYTMGNTGKDWYMVQIGRTTCWVSSGLVEIGGYTDGTCYGVPIIDDSFEQQYPSASPNKIGKWLLVQSGEAHVRKEPSTSSDTVNYALRNEWYQILDCRIGSTGREWYKIQIENEYGWISSGLVRVVE